jgi:hypothetical protein
MYRGSELFLHTPGTGGNTLEANKATHLRHYAVGFRRLAKENNEAGQYQIFAKLNQVASDLEAEAANLEGKSASRLI